MSSNVACGANYMLTDASCDTVRPFLADALRSGISNVLLMTYMPIGVAALDRHFTIDGFKRRLSDIHAQIADISSFFAGGVKLHDYSWSGFYVVLNDHDRLTLPTGDGGPPHTLGRLFDDVLVLSDGRRVPARNALDTIWEVRSKTAAIQPLAVGSS